MDIAVPSTSTSEVPLRKAHNNSLHSKCHSSWLPTAPSLFYLYGEYVCHLFAAGLTAYQKNVYTYVIYCRSGDHWTHAKQTIHENKYLRNVENTLGHVMFWLYLAGPKPRLGIHEWQGD